MDKTRCKHTANCGHTLCTRPPGNKAKTRLLREEAKDRTTRGPRPKEVALGLADEQSKGAGVIAWKRR